MKIKKGDAILITTGKDKGRKSKVVSVFPKINKIIAEGVNLRKKHIKPKREGEKGQIIESPGPFSASNVKIICPKCGKPSRVGYKMKEKKKQRICKKCGQEI
jgi:large subunit ribosomal protein L24